MQSEISWPTVAMVAVIAAMIVAMVKLDVSATTIAAFSAAGVAIAGAMRGMYQTRPHKGSPSSKPKAQIHPPPLPILVLLGVFGFGCSSTITPYISAYEAYLVQQLKCVDEATTLAEAHECRAKVRDDWAVDAGAAGADGGGP
ncbi:MAG: hypothetical protein FWD73_06405 [Polyangiaceae bacterium]|nr:hypothetical protein [Polyangiaceae bacterium]